MAMCAQPVLAGAIVGVEATVVQSRMQDGKVGDAAPQPLPVPLHGYSDDSNDGDGNKRHRLRDMLM